MSRDNPIVPPDRDDGKVFFYIGSELGSLGLRIEDDKRLSIEIPHSMKGKYYLVDCGCHSCKVSG